MTYSKREQRFRRAAFAALISGGVCGNALAGPTIEFGEESFLTVTYAVQMWAQNRGYTSDTDSGDLTDFFLRRNRVTFSGQYSDTIGFYAQLEAGGDSRAGVDDRSVFYRDAYLTFDHSDAVRFIVGRFKNTFTRENLEACLEPLTMDRAEVIAYTPFAGTRDTGVAMWGNLFDAAVQYRVMIADGREEDNVAQDAPRLTARIHWSPLDPEFNYGYLGTYLGTKRVFTIGLAYDRQDNVAYADFTNRQEIVDYEGATADIFFEYPTRWGTVTLSGAYMDFDTGNALNLDPDPTLPVTTQLDAWYAKAGYLFPGRIGPGRLQLFARQEESDYNRDDGFFDQTWSGAGFNYYLDGQRLKLSLEHAWIEFDQEHPTIPSLQNYSQTTAGLQLIF